MATWKCAVCNWDNAEKWDKCAKCGSPRTAGAEAGRLVAEFQDQAKSLRARMEQFHISAAPKWHYLQVSSDNLSRYGGFSRLGNEGWELVSVSSYSEGGGIAVGGVGSSSYIVKFMYLFKRPIAPLPDDLLDEWQTLLDRIPPSLIESVKKTVSGML